MEAAGTEIANFNSGIRPETLFYLRVPLLDVLSGGVRIKGGKANGGRSQRALAQDWRAEVERAGVERCGRGEVVSLLSLREDVRNVVPLVAPGILIDGREEDSISSAEHKSRGWECSWRFQREARSCAYWNTSVPSDSRADHR